MRHASLRFLLALVLAPLAGGNAQTAASTTTLTSSSSSLQLPGSITLTATVAPPQATGGMPSGSVQFFDNATNSLGTAPLKAIPATQNFSAPAINGSFGYYSYGLFTIPSGTANYSVLGVLDLAVANASSGTYYPQLTIYSGQGASLFQTAASYLLTDSNITGSGPGVDAFAVGDFNHDGFPDVLIHGYNTSDSSSNGPEYFVLPGTAGATFNLDNAVISADNSGISCGECYPTQAIAVDDFNGDGYADLAYTGTQPGSDGQTGVALNAGSTAPASFTTFVTAPAITPATSGETFESAAIATGHFTSSGRPDIVVAGSPSTGGAGYVALYINQGVSNGTLSLAAPVLFNVGVQPNSIATADFRANGTTDVVVTNLVPASQSGSVQVLFGDGTGNLTSASTVAIADELASVSVADFNNDGYPDLLVSGYDGALFVLLNDKTGHFGSAVAITSGAGGALTAIGDFNSDGLADVVTMSTNGDTLTSSASEYLNSASSRATLVTAARTLPAGADTLTVQYSGDNNFNVSTSAGVPVTVTQTASVLTWAQPAAMEYGTPLNKTQLNAASSVAGAITYNPPAGTVLLPGITQVTATFVPTDAFDYAGSTQTEAITVNAPTLTGISPSGGKLGDAATTITITGQGLVQGAVVEWNGTALSTTWVSLNQVTAVIPASAFTDAGTAVITVVDPNKVAVAGSQTFTITAKPATVSANVQATVDAGQQDSVTLTVSPYPVPITATLTLEFTPTPPNTVVDPAVLFPNNTATDVIQIQANSTAAIPAIDFAVGSTAGTITVTITLTAGGADITPASLTPVAVVVPAAPPVINSVTLDRSGDTITLGILGLSSTRDMTQATFNFTAAPGASLATTQLTVDLTTAFSGWYQSAPSDAFGTTFLYTQPFTLSSDATDVGSVTVTLTNSQGASQPGTAQ